MTAERKRKPLLTPAPLPSAQELATVPFSNTFRCHGSNLPPVGHRPTAYQTTSIYTTAKKEANQ